MLSRLWPIWPQVKQVTHQETVWILALDAFALISSAENLRLTCRDGGIAPGAAWEGPDRPFAR